MFSMGNVSVLEFFLRKWDISSAMDEDENCWQKFQDIVWCFLSVVVFDLI